MIFPGTLNRVVQVQMDAMNPVSLGYAVSDHPWIDAADGRNMWISMTVGKAGNLEGA